MEIEEARNKKKLTMKQVADRSDVSESMYCLIENRKRRPSVDAAKRIASVLGIDWTTFYPDDEDAAETANG